MRQDLSEFPVFDHICFSEITGTAGSASAFLREFLDLTSSHITLLREELQNGRTEAAVQIARMIQENARGVCAVRLEKAAHIIETESESMEPEEREQLIQLLAEEFSRLPDAFEKEGYRL
ncbi:hypothetical protein K7I13_12385 [Brucepastera parasyntrophica]|uniref:hypothetical protein n=1 Tax=Brucepastera parasyntrophica TaxID=2880008 RepID=UPI00210BE8F7|nr:hypothetical protein [Brucepastera parasyntrophica]ULQ59280.1 hypothetical protein K7I13_12385 [Brucepastera parasyntrophica]